MARSRRANPNPPPPPPPAMVYGAIVIITALALATTSNATNYMVGDTSGWDISTNLDTWTSGKTFYVGDALLFQYSSSYTVEEVTRENFDSCSTTNSLKTYTSANGNTTIPLTRPGGWYFVPGNRLYCLGGMKLQVNVQNRPGASSPAGAPQAQGPQDPGAPSGSLPRPSSKSNDPSVPTSNANAFFFYGGKFALLVVIVVVSSIVLL